ncbi:hypothetical protein CEXT_390331 [Caerostris extrusa]|uniref:Uncharacterized protein n=1 Tax=Caerostris extrusa TaxID=172846 RepID=A0AAV4MKL0_CAEEX|nr:hypothetical protein CEXT_390331 [Caerostris extrusa]
MTARAMKRIYCSNPQIISESVEGKADENERRRRAGRSKKKKHPKKESTTPAEPSPWSAADRPRFTHEPPTYLPTRLKLRMRHC